MIVLIIILVGLISALNVYNIGKYIDGLITENYKSIDASNKMNNCLENQQKAILKYIEGDKNESLEIYYKNNDEFYKWFYIEENNITEVGEEKIINDINSDYIKLSTLFSELQEKIKDSKIEEVTKFYDEEITPQVDKINKNLELLSKLNEINMFKKKDKARINAENTTYFILAISIVAAICGLIVLIIYTNKYFKPVHLLTNTIKSVKEGDINKQAPVIYNDEIGLLATEFNNMTNRLYEYEKSTKGTLLAEKNKTMSIIKSISDPLIVLDSSYKIKFINDSFEIYFDLKEKNVVNKHFLEVIKKPELYDHAFNIINNNLTDDGKLVDISRDGKDYFFNVTVTPIKDKDCKSDGAVVLFRNVTDIKHLEMMKTDFIGTISHELKTPLTSVLMGISIIEEANIGPLNEKQSKIIEAIREDANKLNEMVSNLLKISKLQSEDSAYNMEPCILSGLIKESIERFSIIAEEKQIKLTYIVDENTPVIWADAEKVGWVINNILSNAIRYTECNGNVTIGDYLDDEKIYVYVKDTGRGIPKEYIEKIFGKFSRVDGFEILPESTGLGLAIAKEVVKAHGGEIWCESELNKGSTFTFTIPLINEK